MAIFQKTIPTVPNGTQPDSSLLNTTGFNNTGGVFSHRAGGLLDTLLGTGKADSFYTDFYNNLLTTANAPQINSLWLVFIDSLPNSEIIEPHLNKDNSDLTSSWYIKAAEEGHRPRGIIIAQGVKHVGDGSKFSRDGYANTGLWKGILSNGRSDLEQLSISFLETNLSFVDYALRPWAIAVSHNGLTDKRVRANSITVWHLARMGAGVNLARRKVIKYHNCFPTAIDSQEYNYRGDDLAIQRQITFGFSHYTMENADSNILNILSYGKKENAFLSFLKNQANDALENAQQQFGANNIQQYINNIVERGKSFGESLFTNTVQGAVTNVSGAIQGAIDGAIRDVTSQGLSMGVDAVNAIADATNGAIASLTGSNSNSDTVRNGGSENVNEINKAGQAATDKMSSSRLTKYGYIEKQINAEDSVHHVIKNPIKEQSIPAVISTNKEINKNDVPNFLSPTTNTQEGGISIPRQVATKANDTDTPNFINNSNLLYYKEKSINKNDTPKYVVTPPNTRRVEQPTTKATNASADSNISEVENNLMILKETNKNDSTIGDELVEYIEKETATDDTPTGKQ